MDFLLSWNFQSKSCRFNWKHGR